MAFAKNLGRSLFLVTFVFAAVMTILDPEPPTQVLHANYTKLFIWAQEKHAVTLPVHPLMISVYGHWLLLAAAGSQHLCCLLTLFRCKLGTWLLVLLLVVRSVLIDIPCFTSETHDFRLRMQVFNLALLGGALLVARELN